MSTSGFCCFYCGNVGGCSQEIYLKVYGDDKTSRSATYSQMVQEKKFFPHVHDYLKHLIIIKTKKQKSRKKKDDIEDRQKRGNTFNHILKIPEEAHKSSRAEY